MADPGSFVLRRRCNSVAYFFFFSSHEEPGPKVAVSGEGRNIWLRMHFHLIVNGGREAVNDITSGIILMQCAHTTNANDFLPIPIRATPMDNV